MEKLGYTVHPEATIPGYTLSNLPVNKVVLDKENLCNFLSWKVLSSYRSFKSLILTFQKTLQNVCTRDTNILKALYNSRDAVKAMQ